MPEQVFQSIATREGSVEKIPVNSNDITNKNYVDNLIITLTVGTLLVTTIIIGNLIKLSEDDGVLVFNGSILINGKINAIGDGNITGNLTTNLHHGEMFVDEDITTNIDASGVFFNITINKTGDLNGFTHDALNGILIPLTHGDYFVTHSASFTGGANDIYDITLAINLITQIDCEIDSKLQAGGNEVGISASCILEMDAGDELRMMIANQGATNDPTFTHANIVLFRIGI